jgi:hypothetical protein
VPVDLRAFCPASVIRTRAISNVRLPATTRSAVRSPAPRGPARPVAGSRSRARASSPWCSRRGSGDQFECAASVGFGAAPAITVKRRHRTFADTARTRIGYTDTGGSLFRDRLAHNPLPYRDFFAGGGGRTRTYEGVSQRIYSPPPLPLGTLPRARTSHPADARSGRVMGSARRSVNRAEPAAIP